MKFKIPADVRSKIYDDFTENLSKSGFIALPKKSEVEEPITE